MNNLIDNDYLQIKKGIQAKRENIQPKDIKFFHIEQYEGIVGIIWRNSATCNVCKNFIGEIKNQVEQLDSNINKGGNARKNFEDISKH